jgi:hypothetical protein
VNFDTWGTLEPGGTWAPGRNFWLRGNLGLRVNRKVFTPRGQCIPCLPTTPHGSNFAPRDKFLGGQRPLVPLLLLGPPFFSIILFVSTTF